MENMMISKLNTGKKSVVGIDIGSTTAKIVLVQDGIITFELYERHFSHVREKAAELLRRAEKIYWRCSCLCCVFGFRRTWSRQGGGHTLCAGGIRHSGNRKGT